ncbi:acyltransferase family protein [Nocardioides conyzicola]|uniref:Acyltransferase family protein n=2 Tax=Nocardioides conyzicola TaxID=1651781 RepID=A0ABP8X6T8_9ACTN
MATFADSEVASVDGTGATASPGKRTDIQGLRAIAVALVVVYHLVPAALTGGFVGVDVFFVVSGFLITSHLLTRRPTRPRHLLEFWARRIRRLLPASLLVLLVTLVATRWVAPVTQWEVTARQSAAAATYLVNWLLANDSVDYLAAASAPSPVQHFWSLSVEEQFYAGWPVLVLLVGHVAIATRIAGSLRRLRLLFLVGLGLVVALSFAWSVHLTAANPARAYFVTTTRIWELGLGGLVAALLVLRDRPLRLDPALAAVAAWIGIAAIVWTGFTYTGSTPFPGWQALVPVGGTALVLGVAAGTQAWSPGRLLALRPCQWLGDISYSVYLWHWPLIVLAPAVSGGHRGAIDNGVIVVATLVLAALTKTYVEDVFRTPSWSRRLGQTYALGAAGMAVVIAAAALLVVDLHAREDAARSELGRALRSDDPCFGAGALVASRQCPPSTGDPVPAPVLAALDKSAAYGSSDGGKDCFSALPAYPTVQCVFGDRTAERTVALVGNSHAGQWVPALQQIARQQHWKVVTYLSSRCALADVRQQFDTAEQSTACLDWVHRVTARVGAEQPDLVVVANRVSLPVEGADLADSATPYEQGYEHVLRSWSDEHLPVVVLRDTPAPGDGDVPSVPDCLASHGDDFAACAGSRADWEPADPSVAAAGAIDSPSVDVVDLNDRICGPRQCRPVVGGVVVYFDGSHLTATYARSLSPFLEPELVAAMGPKP